jgi:hypothetical protein
MEGGTYLMNFKEMAKTFKEASDIMYELADLEEKENKGEKVSEDEVNLLMGKFMMAMIKISEFQK